MAQIPAKPLTGMNALANGPLLPYVSRAMGIGRQGCAYRGSLPCLICPFPPKRICDWRCCDCEERALCKCAWTGQETRIARWLGLEVEEDRQE
jgi:hypothetical protein